VWLIVCHGRAAMQLISVRKLFQRFFAILYEIFSLILFHVYALGFISRFYCVVL